MSAISKFFGVNYDRKEEKNENVCVCSVENMEVFPPNLHYSKVRYIIMPYCKTGIYLLSFYQRKNTDQISSQYVQRSTFILVDMFDLCSSAPSVFLKSLGTLNQSICKIKALIN